MLHFVLVEDEDHSASVLLQIMAQHFPHIHFDGQAGNAEQAVRLIREKNPDFIFLDEATNSLDANNERMIVQKLDTFLKNKTVVVVAHRLSTVRHADQIVVIHQGAITERGTHQELVNLKGAYFNLVRNQLELNG